MSKISVLILTKNEAANIDACLTSVLSQGCEGTLEVIVLDSGSTDSTVEIASRYPVRIERILARDFHHAKTRNYAASLATGEFLVYLAADACPASTDWLRALTSNFADGSVAAVYGRHLPKPGCNAERQAVLGTVYGDERILKKASRRSELGYRYYHFSTVNAAIRREVWQAIRFPEDLKVFEDVGIAKRILDSGWTIAYEPSAAVYHSHNHTTMGLFKRYFDAGIIWKRLEIWDNMMRSSIFQEGWRMLRQKLRQKQGGNASRGSLPQHFAKYGGLILGLNERFLPLMLKRRFSAFRLFE